ncbi:SIMPL domain-containing protein [Aurantiacibacter marinus]|uniref:Periplasmic immunogenic protein n=1 Tax=Aurantiacibacter marinus TaxID=874156 RepID=A0A0H0XKK1_9SPHN|nr:SIMPL domain-containing protein [Aurantiacibacter marinus]KLI63148.1 hypothetical protein AAV99_10670 [Aurantiacibacter marinus]
MKKLFIPAIAAAIMTVPLMSSTAIAQVQVQSSGPVVALGVTENVSLDPDIANLSAGVTTVEPTAVEALRQNAQAMTRVIDRIESLGIDEDDIQTSGISLNPDYAYNQSTGEQVFRGYRVMNRVNVKVRDIQKTGEVLDALVAVGATDLGGIGWSVEDPSPAVEQARQAAFQTGREQAREYARMSGYADIRLLQISENVVTSAPMPYQGDIIVTASPVSRSELTPVRPGQINASVSVNFTYELVN